MEQRERVRPLRQTSLFHVVNQDEQSSLAKTNSDSEVEDLQQIGLCFVPVTLGPEPILWDGNEYLIYCPNHADILIILPLYSFASAVKSQLKLPSLF
jgi:hypothetical protein